IWQRSATPSWSQSEPKRHTRAAPVIDADSTESLAPMMARSCTMATLSPTLTRPTSIGAPPRGHSYARTPDAAVARLIAALPNAMIDVRKGGRLGVSSLAFGGPCEITHVQPGSAAATAGVEVGDVVLAVNGEPIASFEALTQRVARHGAGDVLTLSIARRSVGGEPEQFDCSVTLDAW
ncbi:PDZ domain-containing protein, partial [bacterium]|nr:PDZ domain-containing protein [bacterium]